MPPPAEPPPLTDAEIARMLAEVSDRSHRPRSVVGTTREERYVTLLVDEVRRLRAASAEAVAAERDACAREADAMVAEADARLDSANACGNAAAAASCSVIGLALCGLAVRIRARGAGK